MRRCSWLWDDGGVSDGSCGGISSGGLFRVVTGGSVKLMLGAETAETWFAGGEAGRGSSSSLETCVSTEVYISSVTIVYRPLRISSSVYRRFTREFVFSESGSTIVSSDDVIACIVRTSFRGACFVVTLSYCNGCNV